MVESGDRRGRIKAGGICAIGRLWPQFCIWICQNKVQRPRYGGNIVEVFLDRFCTLGMARFYLYMVWQDGVLLCLASPKSEQLGVPTVPGRRGGHRAADGLCFRAHRTLLNAVSLARLDPVLMEKKPAKNWRSGAPFLDLEMPEPSAETQGPGENCKGMSRWISRTRNGEILAIIGIAA